MEAFVYTWTNLETNQLYIGSHKGTPDDGYVCSSKIMLEDYMKNRSAFSRQIVATGSHEDMIAFEHSLLMAVDAMHDSQFYNRHNGNGRYVFNPENHKKGIQRFYDKLTPEQHKEFVARKETPKKKAAVLKMNSTVRTCPHCGKQGKGFGMDRWHMNNCRHQ